MERLLRSAGQPPDSGRVEPSRTIPAAGMLAAATRPALRRLSRAARFRSFVQGEVILAVDEATRFACVVVEGTARAVLHSPGGRSVAFRAMGPGDIFGELAAIDGKPRSADVEAASDCVVAILEADDLVALLGREPLLARIVLTHFAGQIRDLTARVYELSALSVTSRIRAEIVRLAVQAPERCGKRVIAPMPRHEELASRLATHREAVTREIAHLVASGVVSRTKGGLIVNDLAGLAALVHRREVVRPGGEQPS